MELRKEEEKFTRRDEMKVTRGGVRWMNGVYDVNKHEMKREHKGSCWQNKRQYNIEA